MKVKNKSFWESVRRMPLQDFIKPKSPVIKKVSSSLSLSQCDTEEEVIRTVWEYINTFGYKISDEWHEPETTIARGKGDCTDFSFIVSSLLLNAGINNRIRFGTVSNGDESPNPHVWVTINNKILETTHNVGNIAHNYNIIWTIDPETKRWL